jgi:hypothetical protein
VLIFLKRALKTGQKKKVDWIYLAQYKESFSARRNVIVNVNASKILI